MIINFYNSTNEQLIYHITTDTPVIPQCGQIVFLGEDVNKYIVSRVEFSYISYNEEEKFDKVQSEIYAHVIVERVADE